MSSDDAGSAGLNPERVAELLVTSAPPRPGRRGSGYRVSASAVLTAAHVVAGAARVRVRFNADRPGEWIAEGTVAWSNPRIDAAVVSITPRPQDEGQVASVGFGRVAERDVVLACSAMGFPRFKLREDPAHRLDNGQPSQYRDSVHATGTIAVLSNRREGTLEVSVAPPERDPDPERSPWEGMSGAAVWSGGRIVGLVAEHHRADGLGRLAAARVDHWYERLAPEQLDQLRLRLPGLPARLDDLVDVVPAIPDGLVQAGYAPLASFSQLPLDIPDFTDREDVMSHIRAALQASARSHRTAVAVIAISGKPGVGKSALAIHLGHLLRDSFPDGQLYVNLHGAEVQRLDPADVLAEFLQVLGVDRREVPTRLDERASMYRARMAPRRILLLLDNAADEQQVRPLLPGEATSGVMVTSRRRLAALEGISPIQNDASFASLAFSALTRSPLGRLALCSARISPMLRRSLRIWCSLLSLT